jgi:hypothetical protein
MSSALFSKATLAFPDPLATTRCIAAFPAMALLRQDDGAQV